MIEFPNGLASGMCRIGVIRERDHRRTNSLTRAVTALTRDGLPARD